MASHGYKKYMKKEAQTSNPLIKIFIISFFGMLLVFTFLINYMSKVVTVDTSIGDYQEQKLDDMEDKKVIDVSTLQQIQNEDQGRDFSDIMEKNAENSGQLNDSSEGGLKRSGDSSVSQDLLTNDDRHDVVYKVYIGTYTSAEQAKVAKEIIQDTGAGLNPIVKCIGANDYTLQVGIFKNKQSAEVMLGTIQRNNLPARIVQE